ncbi:MAG: hypothetical protein NVSMB65_08960 [Chloroflexota bacterium]
MPTSFKGFLACSIVLLSCLALPGAATSRAGLAAASGAPCQPRQLTIAVLASNGAMGHIGLMIQLHNRSGQSCTLFGYPGAQLLDARHRALPTHLHWGLGYLSGNSVRQTVWLPRGGNAFFILEWAHIPTGNEACPRAPYILITPPNDYSSLLVSLAPGFIDACGGRLNASPVLARRVLF